MTGKRTRMSVRTRRGRPGSPRPAATIRSAEKLAGIPASGIARFGLQASAFPWLKTIAVNYERYKFRSLTLRYVSSAPSTLTGTVAIAFAHDPYNGIPTKLDSLESMPQVSLGPAHQGGFYNPQRRRRGGHSLTLQATLNARPTYITTRNPSALDPEQNQAWAFFGTDATVSPGFLYVEYVCDFYHAVPAAFPAAVMIAQLSPPEEWDLSPSADICGADGYHPPEIPPKIPI